MKQIVVACGSGVATSQTVASKVNRLLKENNIPAEVLAVDIKSVDRYIAGSFVPYLLITLYLGIFINTILFGFKKWSNYCSFL